MTGRSIEYCSPKSLELVGVFLSENTANSETRGVNVTDDLSLYEYDPWMTDKRREADT